MREIASKAAALRARADNGARAVPAVLAALEAGGVAVAAVTVARPSLDDVYLRYAGRTFCADADRGGGSDDRAVRARPRYMTAPPARAAAPAVVDRVTLVQPIIWLLLFGALFKASSTSPGFARDNYIEFLAPGHRRDDGAVLGGLGGHADDRGPRARRHRPLPGHARAARLADRGAAAAGQLEIVIQSVIIVGLALVAGATFPGGIEGVLVLIVLAILIGAIVRRALATGSR